jgi:hypothetical protein
MVLGMGVMTLAVCAWGMRQRVHGYRRLLTAALAWSLPSMIFWLPQPTPINRHYLLATMGIVAIAGVLMLLRLSIRRMVTVTIAVAALNLVVPEFAYRMYNASHALASKTAHGSFFYYHSAAARQIEKDEQVAHRIATCGATNAAESSPHSCALVRWEEFAHVAYALSVSGRRVTPAAVTTVLPGGGGRDVRFKVDDGEVRLITYVYFEDEDLREKVSAILEESLRARYCLFAPGELCARVPELQAMGPAIQGY